jgi:hypothetical protein
MESIKSPEIEVRDGHYFLKLLHHEKARILKLAEDTEKELEVLQSDVRFCHCLFSDYQLCFLLFSLLLFQPKKLLA